MEVKSAHKANPDSRINKNARNDVDEQITIEVVPPAALPSHRVSASHIARGTIYNLLGLGVPLIVALITTPLLVKQLGVERYGVLMIVLTIVGYASLFDLGMSRSLTKVVAQKIGDNRLDEIPEWCLTGLILLASMGTIGGAALFLGSDMFFGTFITVPDGIVSEVGLMIRIVAISVPFVVLSAGLRGILEGFQDFARTNLVRSLLGIYLVICPLFTVFWSPSLAWIACSLLAGRVLFALVYWLMCRSQIHFSFIAFRLKGVVVRSLLVFGGWLTVSGLISPMLVSLDRIVLAGIVSVTAAAYYATAVDLVTRVLIIVSALGIVLFPVFSQLLVSNVASARTLYRRSLTTVKTVLFPVIFLIILFAEPFLGLWLGDDFAANATLPLQILALGVFVNGLSNAPLNVIQGSGRADITAKFHTLELVIYVPALWIASSYWGIIGAALVWTGRMLLDNQLITWYATRRVLDIATFDSKMAGINFGMIAVFVLSALPMANATRFAIASLILSGFAIIAWQFLISPREKSTLLALPNRLHKLVRPA